MRVLWAFVFNTSREENVEDDKFNYLHSYTFKDTTEHYIDLFNIV